jgi:hypothetical protein
MCICCSGGLERRVGYEKKGEEEGRVKEKRGWERRDKRGGKKIERRGKEVDFLYSTFMLFHQSQATSEHR